MTRNAEINGEARRLPELPGNVLPRRDLLFSTFTLKTRRRPRLESLLRLHASLPPAGDAALTLLFESPARHSRQLLSWTARERPEPEPEDPIPESLVFHCRPADLSAFRLFVFRRLEGVEALYWDGRRFYSLFSPDDRDAGVHLLNLVRRFRENGPVRVLTDVDMEPPREDIRMHAVGPGTPWIYLPRYSRIRLRHSSAALRARDRDSRSRFRARIRGLNLLAGLGLLALAGLAALGLAVRGDARRLAAPHATARRLMDRVETGEWDVRRMGQRLRNYPDHLAHLKAVARNLGPRGVLLSLLIKPGLLEIEGLSPDSLSLVQRLRAVPGFRTVQLRDPVTRRPEADRERFTIEITLE